MGNSWVVIASGPSLHHEDCALVELSKLPTIAVNNSWQAARFADVIYAADKVWWDANIDSIDIPARKVAYTRHAAAKHGIEHHKSGAGPVVCSGLRAIQWAMQEGATRIILLGFDCSVDNGTHWHGDHELTGNPCKRKVRTWIPHFNVLALQAKHKGVEILNCSRDTALTCFDRVDLKDALRG